MQQNLDKLGSKDGDAIPNLPTQCINFLPVEMTCGGELNQLLT